MCSGCRSIRAGYAIAAILVWEDVRHQQTTVWLISGIYDVGSAHEKQNLGIC